MGQEELQRFVRPDEEVRELGNFGLLHGQNLDRTVTKGGRTVVQAVPNRWGASDALTRPAKIEVDVHLPESERQKSPNAIAAAVEKSYNNGAWVVNNPVINNPVAARSMPENPVTQESLQAMLQLIAQMSQPSGAREIAPAPAPVSVKAESSLHDNGAVFGLDFLGVAGPYEPSVEVYFQRPEYWESRSFYHFASTSDSTILLVYDTRFRGYQFVPAASPDPFFATINSLGIKNEQVLFSGFKGSLGCMDIIYLERFSPAEVPVVTRAQEDVYPDELYVEQSEAFPRSKLLN